MSQKQIHIETFRRLAKPATKNAMPEETVWQVTEYDRAGNMIYNYFHMGDRALVRRQKFSKHGKLIRQEIYDLLHPDVPAQIIRNRKENSKTDDEDVKQSVEPEMRESTEKQEPQHPDLKSEYYKEKRNGRILYVSKHSFVLPDGTEVDSFINKRNSKGQDVCQIHRFSNATLSQNIFITEDDGSIRLDGHDKYISHEDYYEDFDENGEWHIMKHIMKIEYADGKKATIPEVLISRREIEYYEDEANS